MSNRNTMFHPSLPTHAPSTCYNVLLRMCWLFLAPRAAALTSGVPTSFTLMTYNIHAWRDSHHVDNYLRVVDAIQTVQPDILCLNEVLHPFASPMIATPAGEEYYRAVRDGRGKGWSLPPDHVPRNPEDSYLYRLARDVQLPNVVYGTADEEESSFGRVPFGNALLTKHRVESHTHIPLEVGDGDVHLGYQKRQSVDPRLATVVTLEIAEGRHIQVCVTHLDHKSEELREKQTRTIVSHASFQPPDSDNDDVPRIICGDFNSFRKSDMNVPQWRDLVDFYDSRGWGYPNEESLVLQTLEADGYRNSVPNVSTAGVQTPADDQAYPDPTCWTVNPLMTIDHILYKSPPAGNFGMKKRLEMRPLSHRRVLAHGSDHFPIVAEFELFESS